MFCCSITGVAIAIYYAMTLGEDADSSALLASGAPEAELAIFLQSAYLGHYGCCAGDTWASEVGILSKGRPRLITTCRTVPRGTNGGMSLLGTAASVAGGLFVGVCFWVLGVLCVGAPASDILQAFNLALLGLFSGLFGSIIDSLLGATVQVIVAHTHTHTHTRILVASRCAPGQNTQQACAPHVCTPRMGHFNARTPTQP